MRAIHRALDLLDTLARAQGPMELAALSRATELHPSTAFRILETLRGRHVVRAESSGWTLGAHLFELGSAALRDISVWKHANELVEDLASRANETASLGILEDGEVLYVAIAHGQRELGIQSQPGTRHPVHATALGKVLLAHLPWEDVEQLLERKPPVQLTAKTLTTVRAIQAELAKVAALGYAVDDEERAPGVYCIGAPVRDRTGAVVAAISISRPAFRVHDTGESLVDMVTGAAHKASQLLGAPPPQSPRLAIHGTPAAQPTMP